MRGCGAGLRLLFLHRLGLPILGMPASPLSCGFCQLNGVIAERRLTHVRPYGGHVSCGSTELAEFYIVHLAELRSKFVNIENCLNG